MIQPNLELIRVMQLAAEKAHQGLKSGAATVLHGFEQRQKEYEMKKKDIENDIKRGSRLSKGNIPF